MSASKVCQALFTQSVQKAPGVDEIRLKALELLWQWAKDASRVALLTRLLAESRIGLMNSLQ